MGTGYTRNDTANNIADGNVINAADFDGEYDAIEAAFNSSTGHTHDGTAAEGGPITVLGPSQEFVASSSAVAPSTNAGIDIGTASLKFKDLYIDGTAYIDGLGANLLIDTTYAIQFRDSALSISSSADGQLDIAADTTAKITAPSVVFSDNAFLQSDAAVLYFGADDDVSVTHVADTGLNSKAASGFTLSLQTGDTTVESGNTIGKISFNAPDEASGTDAILVGAEIEAAAEDTFSSTVNSTALIFKTNTSAAATERMRIKADGDIVFKGASYDITFDASAHALTTSASNGDLNITPHGTGSVVITGDLDVDNININGNTISSTDTNGDISITPNGTGKVNISGGALQDTVNLTSTDTGSGAGPTMDIFRNSSSPAASDLLGNITFTGNDNTSTKTTYATIQATAIDVADTTEDGRLDISTISAGSSNSRIRLDSAETVFNEGGIDLDFRVESDDNANMLFVEGSTNRVGVGTGEGMGSTLSVSGAAGYSDAVVTISSGNDSALVAIGNSNSNGAKGTQTWSHGASYASAITFGNVNNGRVQSRTGASIYTSDVTTYGRANLNFATKGTSDDADPVRRMSILVAGGFRYYNPTGNGTVWNEDGVDADFRIESNSRSNAFILDGDTGNIGLNTTNSDFYTGYDTTSIKLGPVASMWSLSNGSSDRRMTIDQNLYVNTSGVNKYLTTGAAARYQLNTGTHRFETAPSGSDDADATLTVQMLILNSGDVRMGLDNSIEQALQFRTSSSAGRAVKKSISRTDSGATNPMVEIQMDGYGTNSYLGQMNVLMTPSDTYNSAQIDVFNIQATVGATFNDDGVSYNDFRVESDGNANALVVDAGSDKVFIMKAIGSDDSVVGVDFRSNGQITGVCNHATRNMVLNNISGGTHDAIQFQYLTSEVGSIEVSSTDTRYNTTSDRRLKTDIQPIANGTEKLMAMNPVTHKWKADPEADAVIGFIAQEMQEVVPEAVSGDPDGDDMMSMDYGRITPVLVAALQDAHKKIEALEKRLEEMEAK
jgi:hypothetical protein